MRELVPVIAAVIRNGERVLIALRPPHKRHGSLWEFPGGKVIGGESHLETAQRELAEELGVAVLSVGSPVFVARDPGSTFEIHFVETEINGEPMPIEHLALHWATSDELEALPLAPTDAAFVKQYLTRMKES